ncbi:MAG TPA: SpoIIE family protein phosphatase [Planctomycetaceae bacterium]|nr:SpoIIE family protein phosphatase [Planctomycetaceae bacterium]
MAFLQMVKGNRPGQRFHLRGERIVLGRHPSCEIVLDDALVSRQHAQIINRHGDFFLEDLRSRNRAYLNGTPIAGKTQLNDADEVKIGGVVFQFFDTLANISARRATDETPTLAGPVGRAEPNPTRAITHKVPAGDVSNDQDTLSSTIMMTLDAKSSPSMRLGIKPEAKLRAILEISNALANTLELDDVLHTLLAGLFKVFPHVDSGSIVLTERDDRKTVVSASRAGGGKATSPVQIRNTIFRQAVDTGSAILSADALKESGTSGGHTAVGPGNQSTMCVPLINKTGRVLGVIQLESNGLKSPITQDDLDVLVSLGSQAILAIENARLHEDLLRRSDIERQLTFAAQVQFGFLPNQRPNPPGYECFDYYEPAQTVGGDYFDYIDLPDGRIAIGLADVAGKGIPAALLMARLYSAVRLHLFTQPTPATMLSALNMEIYSQGIGHRFITFVLLMLDPQMHELTIVNAGHMPPIVRSQDGRAASIGQRDSGIPLGISQTENYRELKLAMEPGTAVVVYTDGVTDAVNPAGEVFGRARLEQFIADVKAPAGELVKAIMREVDGFCGSRLQWDDMCLVCMRRLPSADSGEPGEE